MTSLTIEDVAATSDETAVRRRFDGRNVVWLTIVLLAFLFIAVIELLSNLARRTPADVAIAAPNVVLVALMLFVMRDVFRVRQASSSGLWGVARWISQHVSATVIAYFAVQYVLVIAYARHGNAWLAWAFTFPFIMLVFRLLVSEAVLMHSIFLAIAAGLTLLRGGRQLNLVGTLIALVSVNAVTLGIELLVSNRMRREIVADWSDRRRHAVEQLRMREELRYARGIQLSMLPEAPPPLEWVDVAGVSLPATEVGGDYFDYFVIGEGLAIVSGDVAGHGLASGLVLAALRAGFTLLRDSLHDPAAVLRRLHDLISETTRRRTLVTCAVLLLDRAARRATFASAGHPPVIVRHAGRVAPMELFAPPLGVRLPVDIPQIETPFDAGDVFVLHTDGVYESTNDAGESYGIERIEQVVREHGDAGAAAMRDAIVRDVERFRGGRAQSDDITVVVAKVVSAS